jgi:pimeloyl-ACP methyl ester carboxylesterase
MRALYLHGFASSSKSTKAGYFADCLRSCGVELECPDFNEPDFQTMTMTRMLGQLEAAIARSQQPATLIGSSLGGTLAILGAARFGQQVSRLVLMAPAVMFAKPGHHLLPPERIQAWRDRGSLPFFHHAYNEDRPLDFAFYADSLQYDAFGAAFEQPTLVFQGRHDQSVDPKTVESFAASRRNVSLTLLEDDHQLLASLPVLWSQTAPFLGLSA